MGLNFKKDLTKEQYAAVTHGESAAMVASTAGSGKTRCITYRIAYLLESEMAEPHEILAITFTNKAAAEMKERVATMVPRSTAKRVWISTFHSMCARMLRSNSDGFGVSRNYSIADADDSKGYIVEATMAVTGLPKKTIMADRDQYGPGVMQTHISGYKNVLIRAKDLDPSKEETSYHKEVVKIYQRYEQLLRRSKSLDFDDLLLYVAVGLKKNKHLREGYSEMFRHVLVDEYQDTNVAQYEIMRLLTSQRKNPYVVGDDDQSIYAFRGADPETIKKFQVDYPTHVLYKLERNFRSVQPVADVANAVIVNNTDRIEKTIVTVRPGGDTVQCRNFAEPYQEAAYIVDEILDKVRIGGASYRDFTILYRINSRSRPFEEFLRRNNIPYRIVGALGFYQRKVVKDVVAYLRLVNNKDDYASFNRIYNEPARGIGDRSAAQLLDTAHDLECSPLHMIKRGWYKGKVTGKALDGVRDLKKMYKKLRKLPRKPVAPIVQTIIEDSGYRKSLTLAAIKKKSSGTEVEKIYGKLEMLDELESAAAKYDEIEGKSLEKYLEFISLMQSADNDRDGNQVTLMSVHASKGLEFPHVYLVGCSQNILPHERCFEEENGLEEERRIFFVATTRAEDTLTISHFDFIPKRGDYSPSQFIEEAGDTLEHVDLTKTGAGQGRPFVSTSRRRGGFTPSF